MAGAPETVLPAAVDATDQETGYRSPMMMKAGMNHDGNDSDDAAVHDDP